MLHYFYVGWWESLVNKLCPGTPVHYSIELLHVYSAVARKSIRHEQNLVLHDSRCGYFGAYYDAV